MNVTKYSYKNLCPSDRRIYDELERLTDEVLSKEKLNAYLESAILGQHTRGIFSDILTPFLEYLKEQSEYFKVDMITDCIDGYEDEGELSDE